MTDNLEGKIDSLTEAVEAGFKALDKENKALEGRIEAGFKGSDRKIDTLANAVASGFNEMHTELQGVHKRIDIVDQKVDLLRSEMQQFHFDHKKVVNRIENLELKTFGSVQESA